MSYPLLIVEEAINDFMAKDKQLLNVKDTKRKLHEIAIAHRFAVYLERHLAKENLSVDLEYNKHGENPKTLGGDLVRPDILVHQRGNDNCNLVAIEIKKAEHSKSSKDEAVKRIKGFCGPEFNYKYGYVIEATDNELCIYFNLNQKIGFH